MGPVRPRTSGKALEMSGSWTDLQTTETIVLGSALSGVSELNLWFDALAARRSLSARIAHDVKLCLNEAVTNILLHGFDGDPGGQITVSVDLVPAGATAVIRDNGPAFDPLAGPAFVPAEDIASAEIGGLGIRLMQETTDRINYRRDGEINELTLYFGPR